MKYLPILIAFISLPLFSFGQDTRTVNNFDEITLSGKIEVLLEKGDENKIIIETSGVPEDKVNVTRRGTTLKVSLLDGWVAKQDRVKIRVQYQELSQVKALAGAIVRFSNIVEANRLELKAGSGAEMYVEVAVTTLEASATEGAVLEVSGRATSQYVSAATGGEYLGKNLEANHTEARASTGGEIIVVANESLEATANTGGSIQYIGEPSERYTKSNLAGEISRY